MYLYRKLSRSVILPLAMLSSAVPLMAQYRVSRPPEHTTPRAIGVVETYKNGTSRLVPVSIFYGKRFYDATLYNAKPAPMALYVDTLYETLRQGQPAGTFTVNGAMRQNAFWYGTGKYKMSWEDDAEKQKKSAAKTLPDVVPDDGRPHLKRREGSDSGAATPTSASKQQPAPTASTSGKDEAKDDGRPHLKRHDESADASAQQQQTAQPSGQQTPPPALKPESTSQASANTPAPAKPDATASAPTKPAEQADKSAGGVFVVDTTKPAVEAPAEAQGGKPVRTEAADHPVLRRGAPKQEQGGQDLPDFKKEQPVSRLVAVSDESPTDLHPLLYMGNQEEKRQLQDSMRTLAITELRRLAAQRGMVPPPASATLDNVQFVPYDLDYSGNPTVVYSATYSGELKVPMPKVGPRGSWVVTVIARQDADGRLSRLYTAVSDPRDLDTYPEELPVDAVDADADGRAELLFREQKQEGVSWAIARVTGYGVDTIFQTATR